MATHTLTSPLSTYEFKASAPALKPHRPRSALRRFFDIIAEARYRQAEHEVALYLERTGNKLTDSVEREIERRFLQQ